MSKKATAIAVFVLLSVACIVHALWYYPRLPEQVAIHFGASGKPDAWVDKTQFLVFYLITIGIMVAVFLGFGLAMSKIPNWAINIPNKNYWLAPERRRRTLEYMLSPYLWFGSFTMMLLLYIFHQSFQVNLGNAIKLSHAGIATGIYVVLTLVWCVVIYRRFSKKES